MQRAYSVLEVKGVDDDKRIISGIATTPTADRMGDIVEPLGIKFKNPLPLLWQHKSDQPIGTVKFSKPTKDGISFTAQLPNITETGTLKDRIDEAWQSIKSGLVRGVSIGFKSIEHAFMDDGGVRYLQSEVLELSAVTIPANAEASIMAIKSLDAELRAATGKTDSDDDRPKPPAPGTKRKTVKAQESRTMKKSIAEQISAFEATRQAKSAEMDTIMDAAGETGETLDAEAKQKYDTLSDEVKEIDDHLVRLRAREDSEKKNALAARGSSQQEGSESRSGNDRPRVSIVSQKAAPGIGFVRLFAAKYLAKHDDAYLGMRPDEIAKKRGWGEDIEMVLKTSVAAGNTTDTTWAAPLVVQQNLTNEFIELLTAKSIIPRIPGIRRVPFNIKIPRETTGLTAGWVGEGSPKPLTKGALDTVTLGFNKIAAITVLTQELLRFSTPSAEAMVRDQLVKAITYQTDRDFLDPSNSGTTGVKPVSITSGVSAVAASGTSADAFRADLRNLLIKYTMANYSLDSLVILMTQTQALSLGLMRNDFGSREFPDITKDGGSIEGIPVVTSENIVANGGSPADGNLIAAINASDVLLADDGGVEIDVSTEASVQMDTAPDSPQTASTVYASLWQRNLVGIRAERFITWTKARSDSVQYLSGANYR